MSAKYAAIGMMVLLSNFALAQSSNVGGVESLFKGSVTGFSELSSPLPQSNGIDEADSNSALSLFTGQTDTLNIPDPEDAFILSAKSLNQSTLAVRFEIMDCCYLYQERMSFTPVSREITFGSISYSKGKSYEDAFFGKTVIHRNSVDITIPIVKKPDNVAVVDVTVKYQGCSDAGVCYPPQEQLITVALAGGSTSSLAAASTASLRGQSPPTATQPATGNTDFVSEQDQLTTRLATAGLMALPLFFGLGVLLAFTPCVFPMIPILSGIITADKNITQRRAFLLSAVYVLSMAATYALFGVLAAATGANLQVVFQHPVVLIGFSLLFVVLALSMFGLFQLQVPVKLQQKLMATSNQQQSGRIIAVSMMGVLSALIVGPCVAAPLIGVLSYITMSGDLVLGGLTLFIMGLGMGFPLFIIGTSAGRYLPKAGAWMNTIKAAFGVGLLAVAIWMLERVFAPTVTLSLWAALALTVAVFLRVGRQVERRPLPMLGHALSYGLTTYGILLIIGVFSGATDPLRPLQPLTQRISNGNVVAAHPEFQPVASSEALNKILAASGQSGKPVMLDFYADWCVSCKEMEKYTFSDPTVAALMDQFTLVQADVTKNNNDDKALLTRFGLFGPPAILFFKPGGEESIAFRIMGYMKADPFASVLRQVQQASVPLLSLRRP